MIIITGASDGLGLAVAKKLIEQNKRVVCLSRTKPTDDTIEWLETDLTDYDSNEKTASKILNESDKIEALINSATVVSYEKMSELTPSEIDKMFNTNVTGPIYLESKLLEKIKADQGDIINIGATIALRGGGPEQSMYSTVKWAMRGFTVNLQDELKGTKARAVNLLLGGFQSRLHEKVTGKPIENPDDWMPVEDVAEAVVDVLNTPKTMELSEVVINRKTK